MGEVFCGIEWAESHHDVAAVDAAGRLLFKRRVTDDVAGFTLMSQLLAEQTGGEFVPVDIAIETDRGLLVAALRAAGHRIYAVTPLSVSRYRDRYSASGAKSDPGDALVLAHLMPPPGRHTGRSRTTLRAPCCCPAGCTTGSQPCSRGPGAAWS